MGVLSVINDIAVGRRCEPACKNPLPGISQSIVEAINGLHLFGSGRSCGVVNDKIMKRFFMGAPSIAA